MKKKNFIGFKVSDYEEKIIRAKAAKSKLTLSAYIRRAALDKNIVVCDGVQDAARQLNHIGNNINQITILLRQNRIENPHFNQMKDELASIGKALQQIMNQ